MRLLAWFMILIGGALALGFLLVFVAFLVVGIGSGNIDRYESILVALVLFGAAACLTFRCLNRNRRPIMDGHQS
jgi:hypothetical protein